LKKSILVVKLEGLKYALEKPVSFIIPRTEEKKPFYYEMAFFATTY